MRFVINERSTLAAALKYVLVDVLSISSADLVIGSEPSGVQLQSTHYPGLLPLLRALRTKATTQEQKDFLGLTGGAAPYVNQWVTAASLLALDAKQYLNQSESSALTPSIFAEINKVLELSSLQASFLARTPRATVADVLLYAALHSHPAHQAVPAAAMTWSTFVHKDAYFNSLRSPDVKEETAAAAKSSAAAAAASKPSEEEIQRRRLAKEEAKKAKAAAKGESAPAAAAPAAGKQAKKVLDCSALDLRVGRFAKLERHPEADRLYVEDMDLGSEQRVIVSGLVDHYKAEELDGALCVVVCNMKPRPLKGVTSQGMVLCASNADRLCLVPPPEGATPGDHLHFEGSSEATGGSRVVSSSQMTELLSHLHTDGQGNLCWKDLPARIGNNVVTVPGMHNCVVK